MLTCTDPGDEAACLAKRKRIISRTKELCDDGAHYLWSAEAQIPTEQDANYEGVKFAEVVLDRAQLGKTTFCAATVKSGGTVYVCAGRFRHDGLKSLPPGQKKATSKDQNPSADSTDPRIKGLVDFVDRYSSNKKAQIGFGFDLTPRCVRGDKISDWGDGGKDVDGCVIWAEGCDATQHFDCGGFVRWVTYDVCKVSIAGIKDEVIGGHARAQTRGELLPENQTLLPGDILVYGEHHIAFAIGGETYIKGHQFRVAQAECACYGVNYGKIRGEDTGCIRLTPNVLLGRPVPTQST